MRFSLRKRIPRGNGAPIPAPSPLQRFLVAGAFGGKESATRLFRSLDRDGRALLARDAARHGLESAVQAIAGHSAADVAWPMRERIEKFRYSRLRSATWRIAFALESAGIPAIALKGAEVADLLWKTSFFQPWMRPVGDVDLLVPPERISSAVKALKDTLGLVAAAFPERIAEGVRHTVELKGPADGDLRGITLELHAHLSHSPWRERLEFDDLCRDAVFWEPSEYRAAGMDEGPSTAGKQAACGRGNRARTADIEPRIMVLGPLDEVLFLASHACGHRFQHPKWLADMALALAGIQGTGIAAAGGAEGQANGAIEEGAPCHFPSKAPRAESPMENVSWERLWEKAEERRCANALALAMETLERIIHATVRDAGMAQGAAWVFGRPGRDSAPAFGNASLPQAFPGSMSSHPTGLAWNLKRRAYLASLAMGESHPLFRGALTCLSLADRLDASCIPPLTSLALEKMRFRLHGKPFHSSPTGHSRNAWTGPGCETGERPPTVHEA